MSNCQNFLGLGTRQTNTQTDIQPIPRNWLLDPRVHQHPFKAWQRKWKPYLITTTEFNRGNVNIHFDPDYKCRSPSIQIRWKCIMTHIPDCPDWPWRWKSPWILNSVISFDGVKLGRMCSSKCNLVFGASVEKQNMHQVWLGSAPKPEEKPLNICDLSM